MNFNTNLSFDKISYIENILDATQWNWSYKIASDLKSKFSSYQQLWLTLTDATSIESRKMCFCCYKSYFCLGEYCCCCCSCSRGYCMDGRGGVVIVVGVVSVIVVIVVTWTALERKVPASPTAFLMFSMFLPSERRARVMPAVNNRVMQWRCQPAFNFNNLLRSINQHCANFHWPNNCKHKL